MTKEEMENACDILSQLERFVDIVKKIPGRTEMVYRALVYTIGRNDVNIERLYQKMLYRVTEFGQISDTIGALTGIEKIYNERLSDGRIYLLTEYDKDLRKSNPSYEARWGKQLTNRLGCLIRGTNKEKKSK